jgi:hypothetical protein
VEIVAECAEVEFGYAGDICGSEDIEFRIPVQILSGKASHFNLRFDDSAKAEGFSDVDSLLIEDDVLTVTLPDSVRPDHYTVGIEIEDKACGLRTVNYDFTVLYPSSVIRQKWNNVLALANERYNGGYIFSSYRWYKDEVPIPNATASYLYVGEGLVLDTAAEYRAEIMRADDGVTLMTCPFIVEERGDVQDFPVELTATLMSVKTKVGVQNAPDMFTVEIYDVNGRFYGKETVESGNPYFDAPALPGIYVVMVVTNSCRQPFKIIVMP